jgi:hypothetical protein
MTTLATLERKTAMLEQETRRRYPTPGPDISWLDSLHGDERAQARQFLASLQPHLSRFPSGKINLSELTDDELSELFSWVQRGKAREQERAK